MQEAEGLGILDKNAASTDAAAVYEDALKRVHEEVKKAPKRTDEELEESKGEKKEKGDDEEMEKF